MLYDLTENEIEMIESFRLLNPRLQEPIRSLVLGFRDIPSCIADRKAADLVRAYVLRDDCASANSGKQPANKNSNESTP